MTGANDDYQATLGSERDGNGHDGARDDYENEQPMPMCPHGHGPLENCTCPDCGYSL